MNNVIKSRTDHQVLSFPEEVKLFEEMFKAQDLHIMLAFQQRGDIRLHPRMAHYHRTSTQWHHMKPEQKRSISEGSTWDFLRKQYQLGQGNIQMWNCPLT